MDGATEAHAFVRQRDEERVAAGLGEGLGGRLKADAIAVALDHGGGRSRLADAVGKRAANWRQRAEIDGQAPPAAVDD